MLVGLIGRQSRYYFYYFSCMNYFVGEDMFIHKNWGKSKDSKLNKFFNL